MGFSATSRLSFASSREITASIDQETTHSVGAVSADSGTVPAGRPRLVLEGVTKQWRRSDPPLFEGLDLDLPPGVLALVVGPNAAGKTTLLRIVAGIIAADRGTVLVDRLSPATDRCEYQRRIGFLSAGSTGLYARMSVAQHLDYWARLALLPPSGRRGMIDAALAQFELAEMAAKRADRLSMGERQRLRLALAFLHGPALAVLDEPWNSLDDRGAQVLSDALARLTAGGGSGLVCVPTGHDVEAVPADRVYALTSGRLEQP